MKNKIQGCDNCGNAYEEITPNGSKKQSNWHKVFLCPRCRKVVRQAYMK